jgi:hypothetical protein
MIRVSIVISIPLVALLLLLMYISYGYETRAQSEGSSTSKDESNTIINHYHSQLNVTDNGESIPVPARIGIDPSLWKYHDLDEYGMQSMNMVMPGMAPLHTHDDSGIIHIETSINRNYTLGEFLKIWGIDLDGITVKASVDGKAITDLENHILKDSEGIILEVETNNKT